MSFARVNVVGIKSHCVVPQKKTIIIRRSPLRPQPETFRKIHTNQSSHKLFQFVQPRIQKKWAQTSTTQNEEPATYIPEDVATLQSRMSQYRPIESPRTPPRPDALRDSGAGRGGRKEKAVEPPTPEDRVPKITAFKRNGVESHSSVGSGGRKTSHASVKLVTPPLRDGEIRINGRSFTSYFPQMQLRDLVLQPLLVTEKLGSFDIACRVSGGGMTGQAGAIRHALSNALQNFDPELRPPLKMTGLLTRDNRQVERKKPGKAGARRSFQWVKR